MDIRVLPNEYIYIASMLKHIKTMQLTHGIFKSRLLTKLEYTAKQRSRKVTKYAFVTVNLN